MKNNNNRYHNWLIYFVMSVALFMTLFFIGTVDKNLGTQQWFRIVFGISCINAIVAILCGFRDEDV